MDSLGNFYKKRLGRTFGFALPIILACVALGITGNIMDSRGYPQTTVDGVLELGIFLILIISCLAMFLRKPLPGIFGKWQALWRGIPTWQERLKEKK